MKLYCYILILLLLIGCEGGIKEKNNSDPEFIFESFWNELDRHYAFFTYMDLNWDSVYNVNKSRINKETGDIELFLIFEEILNLFHDAHTNLYAPMGIAGSTNYFDKFRINKTELDLNYFQYYQTNERIFEYGKIAGKNLGYINIKTFEGKKERFEKFDTIINSFGNSDGLIIDVRSNRGGLISNTETILNFLADTTLIVGKYRSRNGTDHEDFSDWVDYYVKKSDKNIYKNPIVILTNRLSYSATEWFILTASSLKNVTTIGDTTGGGSSFPVFRELPNGWMLRISNTQAMLPEGRDFQFTGLYPDQPMWISDEDIINNNDALLEKAIGFLP